MRVLIYSVAAVLLASQGAAAQENPCWVGFAGNEGFEAVVKAKPGVKLQGSNAGTSSYANEKKTIVWNFASKTNPAFPSVVCRRLVEVGGDGRIQTDIRCGATSEACAKLADSYRALDEQVKGAAKQAAPKEAAPAAKK